jgi:hypothetical protein
VGGGGRRIFYTGFVLTIRNIWANLWLGTFQMNNH